MSTSSRNSFGELRDGDRMSQKEFHRTYEQMPEDFRAELLDGVVYVSEPLGMPHSNSHLRLTTIFGIYEGHTPGVQAGQNLSVIMGDKDEVQPDLLLRVLPDFRGQSRNSYNGLYVQGAPELVAEVAFSSRALDLHKKKQRYERAGVIEYIVVCLKPLALFWFDLHAGMQLRTGPDGVFRCKTFPGLWIEEEALLKRDYKRSMDVLHEGLGSDEHAEFVKRLADTQA